jgi:hypothetical protein
MQRLVISANVSRYKRCARGDNTCGSEPGPIMTAPINASARSGEATEAIRAQCGPARYMLEIESGPELENALDR